MSSQISLFTFTDLNSRTRISVPIEEIDKLVGPLAYAECFMRIWEQNRQSELSLGRGLGNGHTRGHGWSKIEFKSPACKVCTNLIQCVSLMQREGNGSVI